VEILVKDLKVFSSFNEELFKEITQLLTLENFRFVCENNLGSATSKPHGLHTYSFVFVRYS
jgi:hypothetical protein